MTERVDHGMLINVAYRLLGSVAEAEDAVQDAYERWYRQPEERRREIASPTAWLVTVTTRVCLDVLGSAHARRERYVGPWLPDPLPNSTRWTSHAATIQPDDPADRVSLDESLSMALLVVLEAMTPPERVAFVLHDVFRYTFAEIGEIVGRSAPACRQLASAARRRVREARSGAASSTEHERVVAAFRNALDTGDLDALIAVLDPDVLAIPDGGGRVRSATQPLRGAESIARYLLQLYRLQPGLAFDLTTVNGQAGLVGRDHTGRTLAIAAVDVAHGRIRTLWITRNPDKLTLWSGRRSGLDAPAVSAVQDVSDA
ncbi:RNA polymerase sigma factor SigJ [Microbacterium sp.]|uniref:RNA polymerase sigma factor SigJ n=1 Tax=Microbacterium sp. TaxID=51671 RepID=UPI003A93E083